MHTLVTQVRRGATCGQPVDQHRVVDLARGSLAAGHDDHVERRAVVEGVVGQDPQALGAPDRSGVSAIVTTRRRRRAAPTVNTSHGPDEVELLGVVEQQDPGGGHAAVSLVG